MIMAKETTLAMVTFLRWQRRPSWSLNLSNRLPVEGAPDERETHRRM